MPFLEPRDMLSGEPLPGWHGRFFHTQHMTCAHDDIDDGAQPLHEHQHEQEEVWHIVGGEVALTVDGVEAVIGAGSVAIVPPHMPHSVRPLGACQAVIADCPLRPNLSGLSRTVGADDREGEAS